MKNLLNMLAAYCIGVLVALDELGHAFMGGDVHITVSAAIGRRLAMRQAGPLTRLSARVLDWIRPGHCERAWEAEKSIYYDSAGLPGGRV